MQRGHLFGGPSITTTGLLSVVAVAALVRIAADVHPTIVRDPLDAGIVTVAITAVVRPCGGGQCNASSHAPGPPASAPPISPVPIASPPVAGPITSAKQPGLDQRTCLDR